MSSVKNNFPPAFPEVRREEGKMQRVRGMTLRDYFANNAPEMPTGWYEKDCKDKGFKSLAVSMARWSYAYADAMMEIRNA